MSEDKQPFTSASSAAAAPGTEAKDALETLQDGFELIEENDLDTAETTLINAVSLADSVQNERAQSFAFGGLGIVYHKKGHTDSGYSFQQKALEVAQGCADTEQEASTLLLLGVILVERERKGEATNYLNEFLAKSTHPGASQLVRLWMKQKEIPVAAEEILSTTGVPLQSNNLDYSSQPDALTDVSSDRLMDAYVAQHLKQINHWKNTRQEGRKTDYLERKFENLYFQDVLDYCHMEIEAMGQIQEIFHKRSSGERKYAQYLESISNVTSDDNLKSNVGGLISALGAAFTTRSPNEVQPDSLSHDVIYPASNCHDSRDEAIKRYQSTCVHKAEKRKRAAVLLEQWETYLRNTRHSHDELARKCSKQAKDAVKTIGQTMKTLSKAKKRLTSARKQYEDTKLEFDAIKSSLDNAKRALEDLRAKSPESKDDADSRQHKNIVEQINTITQEYKRREHPFKQAEANVGFAEEQVRELGDTLVEYRRHRDQLFYKLALQLQESSEERQRLMQHAMKILIDVDDNISAEDAHQRQIASNILCNVNPSSNIRLFVHKAHVKHILHDQTLRIIEDQKAAMRRARDNDSTPVNPSTKIESKVKSKNSGSYSSSSFKTAASLMEDRIDDQSFSDQEMTASLNAVPDLVGLEADDKMSIVPETLPSHTKEFRTGAHINREIEYRPIVKKWLADIFAGKGSERWEADIGEVQTTHEGEGNVINAAALFRSGAGRALFLRYLNTYRGKNMDLNEKSEKGYERLVQVMNWFLDACFREKDVISAKMVMILSETFYTFCDGEEKKKRYVQDGVKSHPIWLREQFWEEAFYRSVREDCEKMYNRNAATATSLWGVTAADSDSDDKNSNRASKQEAATGQNEIQHEQAPSKTEAAPSVPRIMPGSEDWGYTYLQILFGNLGSYGMNMINFGMPLNVAKRTVRRLALGNRIPTSMLSDIIENMESMS